jgi:hypothetical protein
LIKVIIFFNYTLMKKSLILILSVLLSTSIYAEIGPDGTGTVNGYSIGPGLDLTVANLSNADLSSADLSGADLSYAILADANLSDADLTDAYLGNADLSFADLSGADLSGANLIFADLYGADLSGANLFNANLDSADLSGADLSGANLFNANLFNANLSGTIWSNAISQSDYDAVVAERDAAMELAETLQIQIDVQLVDLLTTLDSVQAERDAALAAQASAEAERDAKLTLDEVKDLRAGSTMIEIDNGQATLSMEVEESDELGVWTNESATTIQITKDAEAGKKFFRFKMAE